MKILLLGGTGVMGSYLVEYYKKNGDDVTVTSRKSRDNDCNIKYVQGNAKDLIFVSRLCKDYHWDAIVDFMSYDTEMFRERFELLLNSTEQYIYISTARVYGHDEYPIREISPRLLECSKDVEFLKTEEYSLTKARQEDILLKSPYTNYTIVRPCIIYGVNRLQLGVLEKEEWLYRALHNKKVLMCKEILDRTTTMTAGFDVAKAFINIIGNKECYGQTYHLTCNYHRTWQEILAIYKKTFRQITGQDIHISIVSLDTFVSTQPEFKKYQVLYDRIYDHIFDVSKISTIIDVDKFISPEDGLSECLAEFINDNHKFLPIDPISEAKRDKISGDISSLSDFKTIKSKIKYLIYRFF